MNIDTLISKDADSLTKEESQELVRHYEMMSAKYTAYEQAVKVTLNSIYGAFGNKWFHFFNIDTDSCYVQFEEMYESIEWLGDKLSIDEFIMKLYKIRLDGFITNSMEKYSVEHNTDNFLFFDLETISYSGIWLSKKKYLQDIA